MEISDFYESFFEEAEELLEDMERHLLDLDLDEPDPEQLNAIFRAAHSIKGGAGAFGFSVLQETTHILENLLDHARQGNLTLRKDIVDTFLQAKDILSDQLAAYRQQSEPDEDAFTSICDTLKQMEAKEVGGAGGGAEAPAPAAAASQPAAPAAEAEGAPDAAATSGDSQPEVGEDPNAPPLDRIAQTLQRIAREAGGASAAAAAPSATPAAGEDKGAEKEADAAGAARKVCVTLLFVSDKDRELLLEELGHLGKVLDSGGDDTQYKVTLETNVDDDAIEAVMCFIIEQEQVLIEQLEAPASAEQEQRAEAAQAQQPAPAQEQPAQAEQKPAEKQPASEKPAAREAKPKDAKAKSGNAGKGGGESTSIRVSVDKVDQIINLVGELIITQSMLDQTASQLEDRRKGDLMGGLGQLQRTARDLQEAVMSVRMLPMDYVFSRYPRQVRDLAGKLGKEVELVMEGKSTELDKGLIEQITDPLTHLVRNSLDHGIETPDKREAAGKPRTGTLRLSARHQGGNIVIEVADDGGGLNREKLLEKARSNGLDVSDEMTDDEVWQLIFAPGFSTADQVSDVSGRGVGMDVVKRNIQKLGGQVEIMSAPGEGTTTRVILPLTLAVLDGMTLRVGEEMFVLPLGAVSELIQPAEEDLFTMAGDDVLLKVRDEYLPVVPLHQVMNVPGAVTDMSQCIAVIVYDEERSYALLVDEPVGQQQVVVKNLESNYRKVPGVSAATILGDGRVALILDPVGLHRCEHARKKRLSGAARKPQYYEEVELS